MIAQIAKFSLQDQQWDNLVSLCRQWTKQHAATTDGLTDTYLWREPTSPDACVALVIFKNQQCLDGFCNSDATKSFFDEANKLVDGEINLYHANLLTADLL